MADTALMVIEPTEDEESTSAAEAREHEKIVAAINKKITDAEERNREHNLEYAVIKRLYRGLPNKRDLRDGRSEPGKTRASVANLELFRCIESVTSGQDAVLHGDDPNIEFYDPDLDDQSSESMYHTKKLVMKGHDDMDLRTQLVNAMRSRNLYGRVTVEVCWERKYRWKTVVTPETEEPPVEAVDPATGQIMLQPGPVVPESTEYREVIDVDRPSFKVIPPWRVYMDGESVSTSTWVAVKRHWSSREELEDWIENAKQYGMKTRPLDDEMGTADRSETPGEVAKTIGDQIQKQVGVQADDKGGYDGIDFWGYHPTAKDPNNPKKKDRRMYRICVVNGVKAIVEGLNPYWHGRFPFLDSREIPEEETAEGLGAGQMLKISQQLVNADESLLTEMARFVA